MHSEVKLKFDPKHTFIERSLRAVCYGYFELNNSIRTNLLLMATHGNRAVIAINGRRSYHADTCAQV